MNGALTFLNSAWLPLGPKLWIWNEEYLLSFNVSRSSLVNAKQTKSKILIYSNHQWLILYVIIFILCSNRSEKPHLDAKATIQDVDLFNKKDVSLIQSYETQVLIVLNCVIAVLFDMNKTWKNLFFQKFFNVGIHMHVYSRWH